MPLKKFIFSLLAGCRPVIMLIIITIIIIIIIIIIMLLKINKFCEKKKFTL